MSAHDQPLFFILVGICAFLFFVACLRHYSSRSFLPPESWLLLAGVVYGSVQHNYLPALPVIALSPELVIWLLLPIIIFASARNTSISALKKDALPIFCFAGLGVILTLFLIGIPLSWIMSIPLTDGLFFAAAVAATDPSAVAAIFQRFSIPERLNVLLEGESTFNDGTAIVLFSLMAALVLTDARLSLGQALLQFTWSIAGAIPLGLALGWLAGKLVLHWGEQNRFPGLTLTLLLAYGSYLLGEGVFHVSGVITVLCASLAFIRSRQAGAQPKEGELFTSFWEYLEVLAGSVLFFSLGTAAGAHDFPINWALPGVVIVLLVSRGIVVYGGSLLLRSVRKPLPLAWQHVMMLGGLRGAVSAALVLMIPADYIYRFEMLCLVFVLCLYTLVVHPPLLRLYLQRVELDETQEQK